jgi:hypothetical protein
MPNLQSKWLRVGVRSRQLVSLRNVKPGLGKIQSRRGDLSPGTSFGFPARTTVRSVFQVQPLFVGSRNNVVLGVCAVLEFEGYSDLALTWRIDLQVSEFFAGLYLVPFARWKIETAF